MRIDELRESLHAHGDEVGEDSPVARVQAVRGRIRTARRRRAAAAAVGTATAVAALALTVVPGLGGAPDPGPAQQPHPSEPAADGYVKHGLVFRDEVLGEKLLGAAVGDPGQAEVSFTFTAPDVPLRFSPTCYGVGIDYIVRVSVEGRPHSGTACRRERDPDPGANGLTNDAEPRELLRDWDARPGDRLTVTVTLERHEGDDGPEPGTAAVIGAGVYEDTRPERMVAGVEVPELVEHEGRTWELVGTYESNPGEDRLWIGAEGTEHDAPYLVLAATSGFRGESVYEIRLDGAVMSRDEASQTNGASGPSWQTVRVFRPGRPHELELTVRKGATDRTRLAFLDYEPVE